MFGFNPSNFSDPFDVNKVAGTNSRERAKLKSQTFLTDSKLGGAATGIFAKNKAENIMAKANAGAQSTMNNAALIGGALDFAGSLGSFGAAGGFGNFGAGTDTAGLSDLQSLNRSAADIKTLQTPGGIIDHGWIG